MLIEFRVVVAVEESSSTVEALTRQMTETLQRMEGVRQASIESLMAPRSRLRLVDDRPAASLVTIANAV